LIAKADSRNVDREKQKRLKEILRKDREKRDLNLSGTRTSYDVATAQYAPSDSDDSTKKDNCDELSEEDDDVVFQRRRQASLDEKELAKSQEEAAQKKRILDLKNIDDGITGPLELSSDEETSPIINERKSFRPKKSVVGKSYGGDDESSEEDDLLISRASQKRQNRRDARRAKRAGKSGLGARVARAKKTANDGITADENLSDDWDI